MRRGIRTIVALAMLIAMTSNVMFAEEAVEYPELTEKAAAAIEKGYQRLVKTQSKNGSWGSTYKIGETSLALMAFLVEGHFPGEGKYKETTTKALNWLIVEAKKSSDGYLGVKMYEHGLAVLVFSELWGMTDRDEEVHKALQAGVRVILRAQHVGGGWRYDPQPVDQDSSVTVTILVALASARQAGIVVPDKTISRAVGYLKRTWEAESGGFNYFDSGKEPKFPRSAGATYTLMLSGERESKQVKGGMRYLRNQPVAVFHATRNYHYGHYYAIQAMVQAGLKDYREWYPKIREALIAKQGKDGSMGKKSYEHSMAIIVLGTPYRYIPIYQE